MTRRVGVVSSLSWMRMHYILHDIGRRYRRVFP